MFAALERCRTEVASLADAALARARGAGDLVALLADVEALVARELRAGRAAATPLPACGPGCRGCCTVNVATLAVEGAVAATFLRAQLDPPEAARTAACLTAFHDRIRWLEDRERVAHRHECPLLDEAGRCAIHPVRPLACRSVSSLDPEDCRRALAQGDDDGDGTGTVRMDLLQKALYGGALSALAAALARRGLDARCRDVSGMTGLFLGDAGAVDAWLSGERLALE